ncbi:hypothetical protein RUM44_004584 [Polyplax serrata]|uniref:Uncharacterized protein n=1 Tax=Polyplax serrata TaxID=468196 RepID=A0ABR1B3A9_POLSC
MSDKGYTRLKGSEELKKVKQLEGSRRRRRTLIMLILINSGENNRNCPGPDETVEKVRKIRVPKTRCLSAEKKLKSLRRTQRQGDVATGGVEI